MSNIRPKLTNPLRPAARYRKGQAPVNVGLSDSDSDSDAEGQDEDEQEDREEEGEGIKEESDDDNKQESKQQSQPPKSKVVRNSAINVGKMGVSLREVQVDSRGGVLVGGKEEVGRTDRELQGSGSSSEEDETDEEEEESKPSIKPYVPKRPGDDSSSGEYETDSEDEPTPIYKPVFVSKRNRDTLATREAELDPEVLEAKRIVEMETRKKQSHDLVAETILRELAEKEVEEVFPQVDDTDGLEPQLEFEAWKLRELMRIKRDKEAQYAREKDREEVEARRAMPETLRMKEDMERAQKTRDEKKKGSQVFLQKYHHKGAFYTENEVLKKHDYTEPTTSTNRNVESLPAVMQVRNFGKRAQTKYTHLAKEDTTNQGESWGVKRSGGGYGEKMGSQGGIGGNACFGCGKEGHVKRDCPELSNGGPSGSNTGATRDEGWGSRPTPSTSTSDPTKVGGSSASAQRNERRVDDRSRNQRPRSRSRSRDRERSPRRRGEREAGRGGDWDRGVDKNRERYELAERGMRERARERDETRERERGAGGYRDRDRDGEGEGRRDGRRRSTSRSRSRSRNRSPRRGTEEKRRRVD